MEYGRASVYYIILYLLKKSFICSIYPPPPPSTMIWISRTGRERKGEHHIL